MPLPWALWQMQETCLFWQQTFPQTDTTPPTASFATTARARCSRSNAQIWSSSVRNAAALALNVAGSRLWRLVLEVLLQWRRLAQRRLLLRLCRWCQPWCSHAEARGRAARGADSKVQSAPGQGRTSKAAGTSGSFVTVATRATLRASGTAASDATTSTYARCVTCGDTPSTRAILSRPSGRHGLRPRN